MSENQQREESKHPTVTEHPEQRRQEETGREDPAETNEIGRPPSQGSPSGNAERAA